MSTPTWTGEKATRGTRNPVHDTDSPVRVAHENNLRAESCPGPHKFEYVPNPYAGGKEIYRCVICGCTAIPMAVRWYEDGLRHGARIAAPEKDFDEICLAEWDRLL